MGITHTSRRPAPARATLGEIHTVMSFAVLAATFVTEPGTWPAFTEWAAGHGGLGGSFTIEDADDMRAQLVTGMTAARALYEGSAR